MTTTVPFGLPGADPNDLYVDGKPLAAVVEALTKGNYPIGGHRHRRPAVRFWSTPPRPFGSKHRDVIEVRLGQKKHINRLRFDVAHFPQTYRVEYWDYGVKAWMLVNNQHQHPIERKVHDSKPRTIAAQTHQKKGHIHAQHYGSGHWLKEDIQTWPIVTDRLRWVFTRHVGGTPPHDRHRRAVDYSLGLRNVAVSYRVRDRKHIPRRPGPITTGQDIFGSPVRYELRENPASDLLVGKPWKSEPQPSPQAVVCFYMNTLDESGDAQVIDRFYLEPTTSGGSVNIYFSNDVPSGDFEARDTPLNNPYTILGGAAMPTFDAEGVTFPQAGGYLSIDNRFIEWQPQKPWWLGMVFQPKFDSNDAATYTIFDTGDIALTVTQGIFSLRSRTTTTSFTADWALGQRLALLLSYDGTSVVNLSLDFGGLSSLTGSTLVSPDDMPPPTDIRLGGDHSKMAGAGNYLLKSLVLKESSTPDLTYFDDPTTYNMKSEFLEGDTHTSDNALIRYDPVFLGTGNDYGFVGGAGDRYANLVWNPIQRDFKVVKGYYYIPPTKARYFKFEFTNLTPEPYEVLEPVYRKVLMFPAHLMTRVYLTQRGTTPSNSGSPGSGINQLLAGANPYPDQAQIVKVYSNPTNDDRGYTPTEVQVATNVYQAKALSDASYLYRFQAHQGTFHIPRWPLPMVHHYEQIEVLHDKKVAYFIGLSAIKAFRLAYTAADDTEMYVDLFHDRSNVAQMTFAFDEGNLLHTTDVNPVLAQSKVFTSNRAVRAVQFATTQSPPKQLLPDPDFDDPTLGWWAPVGDAAITSSDQFSTWIGTTALVERGATHTGLNNWNDIEREYATWDELETATWDELEGGDNPQEIGGIETVQAYEPAPLGRLYAAARVTAPQTLTAPLWVQIVDATGNVLAEEPITVAGGEVAEWFTGFTIGSTGAVVGASWDDLEGKTWDDYDNQQTWDQLAQVETPTFGNVRARLVQKVSTSDQWHIDTLSLFQDTIVWEFSNDGGKHFYPAFDIRNDPHGVLAFPPVAPDTVGNQLVWRVRAADADVHIGSLAIRPWYGGLLSGIMPNESINVPGPNMAPYDHYMPIVNDPRWQVWSKPIPEEWWFFFRQFFMLPPTPVTVLPPRGKGIFFGDPFVLSAGKQGTPLTAEVTLSEALVITASIDPTPAPVPPPPPAPAGFVDDFNRSDRPLNGDSGWVTLGTCSMSIAGSHLDEVTEDSGLIFGNNGGGCAAVHAAEPNADGTYYLAVDVWCDTADAGAYLDFMLASDAAMTRGIELNPSAYGAFDVYEYDDTTGAQNWLGSGSGAAPTDTPGVAVRYEMLYDPATNAVTITINGTQVLTGTTTGAHAGGYIGVGVQNRGGTWHIDNVTTIRP